MTLHLVGGGEGAGSQESRPKSLSEMTDREAMAAALPYLRRLGAVQGDHLADATKVGCQLLCRSIERRLDPQRFGGGAA